MPFHFILRPARLWILALVLALAACTPAVPEVQRLDRYAPMMDKPLAQRLMPADKAVLDRAHQTNRTYGDDVRPTAAPMGHPLAAVVRRVLETLPDGVVRLAERYLTAVFLVENDMGTATTEGVWDESEGWRHAYIVLNLTALSRTANAWATWKERSAFRPHAQYDLRVTLEPPETDDQEGAVRFILLHELGHVVGLGRGVHGYWDDPDYGPAGAFTPSPFASLSWEPAEEGLPGNLLSRHARFFPRPHFVDFYRFAQARSDLSAAPVLYRALARTDFPSLYGTLNVFDDFAEAFAIQVHTALLGKPYRVEVLQDGRAVETYHSCLDTGDCPRKAAILQTLLE